MLDNIGHIDLKNLENHVEMIRKFDVPVMPLGPIPTDIAIDNDHIAAAIGASFSCYWGIAHIINSISPFEHSKSEITTADTIKAVETAKLVAHIINLTRFSEYKEKDVEIFKKRSDDNCCITGNPTSCNRCSDECPLKLSI
jgi:phosphomethylpyrimidine synthase